VLSRIIKYLSFCDWLILLGIMSSRLICVIACVKIFLLKRVETKAPGWLSPYGVQLLISGSGV